eukprot:gene14779-20829_t
MTHSPPPTPARPAADFRDSPHHSEFQDDFLSLGLAAFEDISPEDSRTEQEMQQNHHSNPYGRSFSMNDLQSLQHNPQPVWGRQASMKPALQSVPEWGPALTASPITPITSQTFGSQRMQPSHPSIGSRGMQPSHPSMGNLSAKMDSQLQIMPMKAEDTLSHVGMAAAVDSSQAGSEDSHGTCAGLQANSMQRGHGVTQAPMMQKQLSSGPCKPNLPPQQAPFFRAIKPDPGGPGPMSAAGPVMSSAPTRQYPAYEPPRFQPHQQGGPQGGPPLRPPQPAAVAFLRKQAKSPSGNPLRKSQSALELCSWRNTTGDLSFWDPSGNLAEQLHGMQGARGGRLNPEERLNKILHYRQKRQERNFNRTIKYQCRKSLADTRPRVRGRFARNDDVGIVLPHDTKKAQRERVARAELKSRDIRMQGQGQEGGAGAATLTVAAAAYASPGISLQGSTNPTFPMPLPTQAGQEVFSPHHPFSTLSPNLEPPCLLLNAEHASQHPEQFQHSYGSNMFGPYTSAASVMFPHM